MPGVSAPAVKNAVVWNTLSPRAGLAYAIGEQRKTVARASYSAFASQLLAPTAGNISSASFAYAYYLAVDDNKNFNIEQGELRSLLFTKNIVSSDPSRVVNQIDPDFSAPRTHELVVGLDREMFPNFGVSAAYTWRRYVNQLFSTANVNPPIGATSAGYVEDGRLTGTLPDGTPYDVPYYALSEDAAPEGAGTITKNRKGYHRSFNGLEIAATKRLSNRWMGRFAYSWNRSREYLRRSLDVDHRSDAAHLGSARARRASYGGDRRQRQVADLPDAADLPVRGERLLPGPLGRQLRRQLHGAPGLQPDVLRQRRGDERSGVSTKDVLLIAGDVGKYRLPAVTSLDTRIEKAFTIRGTQLAFDVDVFNLLNHGTVLGRVYDVDSTRFNEVAEIMNPRIARFGLRIQF